MEWIEESVLPEVCRSCREVECYNCDAAGQRWALTEEKELQARKRMMERAIKRLERKIAEIDVQLRRLHEQKPAEKLQAF